MIRIVVILLALLAGLDAARAQTLNSSDFRIEWQVTNRFRLFRDVAAFKQHENAWRQYLLHVDKQNLAGDDRTALIQRTSVLGSEHVLNDRHIAFSQILRDNFDWRGWAAKTTGQTCYDSGKRRYSACGGIDAYLKPTQHAVELWLSASGEGALPTGRICEWRIGGALVARAGCGERVSGPAVTLPYPGGADISVAVAGEQPIIVPARVRDLLIAGLGDSFASGEGNPDVPVEFDNVRRYHNLYPVRKQNDSGGSATWTDQLCHRSLYGQQFRAALQIAVENRQAAVTYLDYSCSGASIDAGILGGQEYVERVSDNAAASQPAARPLSGGSKDSQLYRLLRDLCIDKPDDTDGQWTCPDQKFRRGLDLVFLSIGGNDIGFSNIVAWATIRDGTSSNLAAFFGATVSADEFSQRMRDVLPDAYARLAKAFEQSLPLYSGGEQVFDPSRVVLSAYPELVTNQNGDLCEAGDGGDDAPDKFVANQSLDMFSSWLEAREGRLKAVRQQFGKLFTRMRELALDHGWSFAGRAYADRMFEIHGFCARDPAHANEPAETLMIPCWGEADRPTQSCQSSWSSKAKNWRLYDPATQNYPYALRQRWVRTFNDAYMTINQKVVDRSGHIDEKTSAAVFSETIGALHPTAEGHAAMADALLIDVRPMIEQMLAQ